MRRAIQHGITGRWHLNRLLGAAARERITQAITKAELGHAGQIRVVVEGSLGFVQALVGQTARERAVSVFSTERIWDTERNSGVLLYILVADRDAEIVVDRGFNGLVETCEWEAICKALEASTLTGGLTEGVCLAVDGIGEVLRRVFPTETRVNELPDTVVVR